MITKGYIISKSPNISNKYLVRIPIFETTGIGETDSTLNSSTFDATLCYNPGNLEGYLPGDAVFIGFEDNKYSKPIILGKLYLGIEKNKAATSNQYINSLEVTKKAILPPDTKIGEISLLTILEMYRHISNLDFKKYSIAGFLIVGDTLPEEGTYNTNTLWLDTGYNTTAGASAESPLWYYYDGAAWTLVGSVWK